METDYSLLLANFLCLLEDASDSLLFRSWVRANCPALRDSGWKIFSRLGLAFVCDLFGEAVGAIVSKPLQMMSWAVAVQRAISYSEGPQCDDRRWRRGKDFVRWPTDNLPNVLLSLLNTPTIILFNLFELSSQSRMETDSLNSTDCYRERIPSTNFVQPSLRAGLSSLWATKQSFYSCNASLQIWSALFRRTLVMRCSIEFQLKVTSMNC